jgi:hypothetical protein
MNLYLVELIERTAAGTTRRPLDVFIEERDADRCALDLLPTIAERDMICVRMVEANPGAQAAAEQLREMGYDDLADALS